MSRQLLFVHGGGDGAYEEDRKMAASATGSKSSRVILLTLLGSVFMGSARLVDVVEDRLYAFFTDPGAVLDVTGALEVG
jgi:hypothetical protein